MFESLNPVPADPLLGIIGRFRQEQNPHKIDLGVGVYKNEAGHTPVLESVKKAEQYLVNTQGSKAYLGPQGNAQFSELLCRLSLGDKCFDVSKPQLAALQTPGGCGALRVAAELIVRAKPGAKVWVSDPTWANHEPLLGGAGIALEKYPYYDYQAKQIRFDAMMEGIAKAAPGDLVLLHACCHNPSGADLSRAQWDQVVELLQSRDLIPFIDMAYQGFGQGLEQDAYGLRLAIEKCSEVVFTVSCSKNFGLYRDRVGLVAFKLSSAEQATTTGGNLAQIVRGIYSMPPDHGASVVAQILAVSDLSVEWQQELEQMRARIATTRLDVVAKMKALGASGNFDFIAKESGMFSFLGLAEAQVERMAQEHAIYMAPSSRINIAGLNSGNLEYFCQALNSVL
ncbi:MAG: aspartate/tyrosine/aromatic aminotransferase [Agarilytica sp.]